MTTTKRIHNLAPSNRTATEDLEAYKVLNETDMQVPDIMSSFKDNSV